MSENDGAQIESLFKEISEHHTSCEKIENKEMKSLRSPLLSVIERIKKLQIQLEERLRATRGRFNLFTTLLKAHDETRLHSRFIAHLLDSNGNHDCGNLFLNLFIDTVNEENSKESEQSVEFRSEEFVKIKESKIVCCRTEQPTESGRRIDIYLKFEGFKIAIENKIWAEEQSNQIADYAKYIKSEEINNFLLYLTLDGKESTTAGEHKYLCISYEKHILKWLGKCLKVSYKYININQAIQQYENVVKQLTNQTMENEDMNIIKDMIKNNPMIIKYQSQIDSSVNEIKRDFIGELLASLSAEYKAERKGSKSRLFVDISLKEIVSPITIRIRHDEKASFAIGVLSTSNKNDKIFYELNKIFDDSMSNDSGRGWAFCALYEWHSILGNKQRIIDLIDTIFDKLK